VSHDRALLRAVCDEFWLVTRGGIEPFEGDLDDYQKFLLDEAKRLKAIASAGATTIAAAPVKAAIPKPVLPSLKNMQKELAQIEAKMQTLETQRNELHALMANKLPAAALAEKGKLLKHIDQELPALETRWLELTGQLESATASS